MPLQSSEVVFGAWNAHTKYCRYCLDALRRLKVVRFATFFAAACMAIVRPFGAVGTLAASMGLAGVGFGLNKAIGMFYRYEFSHAHND